MVPKIVVADFDDVMCSTTLHWAISRNMPNPSTVWSRKLWDLSYEYRIDAQTEYIRGDFYDDKMLNKFGEYLLGLASSNRIKLYVVSSPWTDTDDSKRRMFERVFPKEVSAHVVPVGMDKPTFISTELKLDVVDVFIDDYLKNHMDISQSKLDVGVLAAPRAPFTFSKTNSLYNGKMIRHYTPPELCEVMFYREVDFL